MADVLFHNTPSIKCLQLLQKEECLKCLCYKTQIFKCRSKYRD
nr:MAG TPA: hypothetical protein [Herelleviridae sp.]